MEVSNLTLNRYTEIDELGTRYDTLTQNIAAAEQNLAHLDFLSKEKVAQLDEFSQQFAQRTTELNELAVKTKEMNDTYHSSYEQNLAAVEMMKKYKEDISKLLETLTMLKETNRVALLKDYKNEQN